ncbi:MAG: RNA pseudouridine synthase [Candidatus Falkowbacteria bacterium]
MEKKLKKIVIFENDDYLIINKPAGLIVHGGPGINEEVLTDWLRFAYPEIESVGEDPLRPGIVHRLDKEASGLMIIAKNQKAFNYFKKQFQNRHITKKYLALAHGQISKDEDVINFPIRRARDGYKMAALPVGSETISDKNKPNNRDRGTLKAQDESKEAITEFSVIKKYINYTLLDVKIKTGRTHQIRVHFYAYGHPLLGDPLYFTKKTKVKNQKVNLGRIFLVAYELNFKDLNGEKQKFNLDLPNDLETFLEKTK